MSKKLTKKQTLQNRYLTACQYFETQPEQGWEKWTTKQLERQVNWFATKYRATKVKEAASSVAQNTAHAARCVKQRAGETRKSAMARAKALMQGAGKRLPSIKVLWND